MNTLEEAQKRIKELEQRLGMYDRIMFGALGDQAVHNNNLSSMYRHQLLTIYARGGLRNGGTYQIGDNDIAAWTSQSNLTVCNGIKRLHENGHIGVVSRGRSNVASVYRINL